MDYHIDHRIVLNDNPEHKGLYKWCLQELDDDGQPRGRDLIPWGWTLYFTATELTIFDSLKIEPEEEAAYDDPDPRQTAQSERRILAKLKSGDTHAWSVRERPTYSMMGTDRIIEKIELVILESKGDGRCPHISLWGGVAYTSDSGIWRDTVDDALVFTIVVDADQFEHYERRIAEGGFDELVFCVRSASGFYSDWSPDIQTDKIKVLTDREDEHPVEIPEDCQIVPWRTGTISEVDIWFRKHAELREEPGELDDDEQDDSSWLDQPEDMTPPAKPDFGPQVVEVLRSLRAAGWLIVALLVAMIIF